MELWSWSGARVGVLKNFSKNKKKEKINKINKKKHDNNDGAVHSVIV